jgi:hypothetical protein
MVNLRLTALGRQPPLTLAQPSRRAGAERERPPGSAADARPRPACCGARASRPAPPCPAPAVIEALDSTTVLPPGWTARVTTTASSA